VETFLSERYNLNISHGISEEAMGRILADARVKVRPGDSRGEQGRPPG
jgi:hypothetical protein